MEVTIEEIQKKFESLPEEIKWAVMAANVDDNIMEIGKSEQLTVAQMGQLSLEAHMVMLGFTDNKDLESSIKTNLDLPEDKAARVAATIREKILKEVLEKMHASYGTGGTSKVAPPVSPALKEDHEILKSAGIEILEKKELPGEGMHPLLMQKMNGLNNMSEVKEISAPATAVKTYPKGEDPYRIKPE